MNITCKDAWGIVNTEESLELLSYLRDRWLDELGHEDAELFKSSALKLVQQNLPDAYIVTIRPMGFKCKCTDGDLQVYLCLEGKYMRLKGKRLTSN